MHKLSINLTDFIDFEFVQKFSGKEIDKMIQSLGGNFLSPNIPFLAIPINSEDHLQKMLLQADYPHIFVENSIFHINALYERSETFPAARVYYMNAKNFGELLTIQKIFKKNNITLNKLPILNNKQFEEKIDEKEYIRLYQNWQLKKDEDTSFFSSLFAGRERNTIVNQAVWLNSEECLICKSTAELIATTSIFQESGMLIGAKFCELHYKELSQADGLMPYLKNKFKVPSHILIDSPLASLDDIFIYNCIAMQEQLGCYLERNQGRVITGIRPSGVRVICRLDALDDYAYNINLPNGQRFSRIDSSNHHSIAFAPDHIHRRLTHSQKNKVESSFTYGLPFADYKIILELVEAAETTLDKHEVTL